MKKIYIASRFQFDKEGSLKNDIRSKFLGDEKYLLNDLNKSINILGKEYLYSGPFFNEKAAEHDLSASFGKIVVEAEKKAIDNCDTFIVIFDNEVSPGSVTELIYAAMIGKECYVFYLSDNNKSENWFPIEFVKLLGDRVRVIPYTNKDVFEEELLSNFSI